MRENKWKGKITMEIRRIPVPTKMQHKTNLKCIFKRYPYYKAVSALPVLCFIVLQ